MTFLKGISEEEATGKVREIYEIELKNKGSVGDATKVFSLRPEFMEAWQLLNNSVKANMEERYYLLATIVATAGIRNTAWTLAHGAALRSKYYNSEKVEGIIRDYKNADLEPKEQALIAFAEKVLTNSHQISQKDIDILKSHGFSEEDIFNITLTVTSRSFFSRTVDVIGFEPPAQWLNKTESLLGKDTFKTLNVGRLYNQKD